MELKQAAQDLKDLRALRSQAQKRPDTARYVLWGALSACTVLVAAVSIALAINATRTATKPVQTASKPAVPAPAASPATSSAKAPVTAATDSKTPPAIATKSQTDLEISKLQDALRALAAERDRLVNRVDQLERSVGDITASIAKEKEKPAPPPAQPAQQNVRTDNTIQPPPGRSSLMPPMRPDSQIAAQNPPGSARGQSRGMDDEDEPPAARSNPAPAPGTFNRATQNARQQIHAPPVPQAPPGANRLQNPSQQQQQASNQPFTTQSTDSTATRTEFAIDLGGEASIDGLRALWANIRGNHGAALEGLRPLVSVRDGVKPGTVELRLIAGPLANASAAARACATLHQKGVPCQTAIFDGQRLALR